VPRRQLRPREHAERRARRRARRCSAATITIGGGSCGGPRPIARWAAGGAR
jgi:hypothetical protein